MNRRNFVKTSVMATSLSGFNILHESSKAENDPSIIGHNTHKYKVVKGWGILDAGKNPVNDCHEMVEDAQGRLIMVTNETKNNIIIYDKSGKLLDTWGDNYIGGHGLTITNEGGEQFLFICDPERHQVIKTDLKGRELMIIDYPKESGVYAYPTKFKPTESSINPVNGDIYVADGYGSNYVMQYDRNGKYIQHFGGYSPLHTNEQFDCCHGVLVDTRSAPYSLLITDRRNNCLKRFTLEGKYLDTYTLPGSYICRPVMHGDYTFGAVFRSGNDAWNYSGYIQILDKNMKAISTPGGTEPIYIDGQLQKQFKYDPINAFMHPHDVYIDSDENIYIPQWASQKTYPVKLERIA
ncbi:MAG: 6-bladed beta-propeller [Saprospiraceae bacterium]